MRCSLAYIAACLTVVALCGCGSNNEAVPSNETTGSATDEMPAVEIEDETAVLDVEPTDDAANGGTSGEAAVPAGPRPSVWAELIMAPLNQMVADSGTAMQQSMGQMMSGQRSRGEEESATNAPVELPESEEATEDSPASTSDEEPSTDEPKSEQDSAPDESTEEPAADTPDDSSVDNPQ